MNEEIRIGFGMAKIIISNNVSNDLLFVTI